MKKRLKTRKLLLFVFAFALVFGLSAVKTEAAAKKATIAYDQASNKLNVFYKGSLIGSSHVNRELVYARTDIVNVKSGPGNGFSTVKKMKLDVGEPLLRMGQILNNTWSIMYIKGKFCFINNYYLSYAQPVNMLSTFRYKPGQLKRRGVIRWGGWRWTWYSQKVLRGRRLHIPGRHVDKHGYICDEDGYICLASGRLRRGTVVNTPFGKKGKVYDSGCGRGTLDVYTNF